MAIMCTAVTFVYDCGHKLLCRTGCLQKNPNLCEDVMNTRARRYYECYMCIERSSLENNWFEEHSRQQFEEKLHIYRKSDENLDQDMEGCIIGEAK